MIKSLQKDQLKRLSAFHGWSGLVLGLLLYAVILTGTVVVFSDEIRNWSVGGSYSGEVLPEELDDKVRDAMDRVSKGYRERVTVRMTASGDLLVFARAAVTNHKTGEFDELGELFLIDPETGETRKRQYGYLSELEEIFDGSALENFLVRLHIRLYIQSSWGLILTGVLGLTMMASGLSGLLIHRHLIRDLFTAERPGKRLVSFRDKHVLAASWSLPFTFILGLTGSFFSFAVAVGLPVIAMVAFGGDQQKLRSVLFSPDVITDERPAPLTSLDDIARNAAHRLKAPVRAIEITNYDRADATVRTSHLPADGTLYFKSLLYRGSSGEFLREKPLVGQETSTGNSLLNLMSALHFGNFAGILSRLAWFALGGMMSYVVISGLRMWVKKRENDPLWQHLAPVVSVVAYGLPLSMLASAYSFFLFRNWLDEFWWTPFGFVLGMLFSVGYGYCLREDREIRAAFLKIVLWACLLLPLFRIVFGGVAWVPALQSGNWQVLWIDFALAVPSALLLFRKATAKQEEATA